MSADGKLFEIKDVDERFYREKIRNFLPERIIDIHTHIWLKNVKTIQKNIVKWPSLVADENSVEQLLKTYEMLLPGKNVKPLVFNSVSQNRDTGELNRYVKAAAEKYNLPSLMLSRPDWTAEEYEQRIKAGNYLGVKPYLTFAHPCIPAKEIRILDFIPRHQLSVLNKLGKMLMLHIPRDGRLKDPINLRQMLLIEKEYPAIKLIIAHVGRAYCPQDIGDAFKVLGKTEKMLFDISANTNVTVFRRLIEAVGAERILFGSDLPITRMRMRRICEKGIYVNLVPAGLYGDIAGDKNMREVSGSDAEKLSFFLYEEIDAFRRAAEKEGLSEKDIEKVFYSNANTVIDNASSIHIDSQLHMIFPRSRLTNKSFPKTPDGYTVRCFRHGDEPGYISLMRKSGFSDWNKVGAVMNASLPGGIIFVLHEASKEIVATASALHNPSDLHPWGGEIGWVAVSPEHRRKKLGKLVCLLAVKRLLDAGYSRIYLKTDDFRVNALKLYVSVGFIPVPFDRETAIRWKNLEKTTGCAFKYEGWRR